MSEDNTTAATSEVRASNAVTFSGIIKLKGQTAVQLDESNYIMWKYQIETAIKGHGLEEYINGTLIIPPKMVTDDQNKITSNQEFIFYQRQDNLLATWLMSSISTNILSHVVGCKTSQEIWEAIDQFFNSQSSARIIHYKRQLQNLRKNDMTMREYVTKAKNYCDLLSTAGYKVSETEQILTILSGLDEDYESIVAVISAKKNLPNIQYVHATLLAHEGRIDQKKVQNSDYSINYTSVNKKKSHDTAQNSNKSQIGSYRGGNQNSRGRGKGRSNNFNRPKCQICEKIEHTASKCYFRFDQNYSLNNNNNNQRPTNPNANLAHTGMDTSNPNTTQPSKNEDAAYEEWYPDSGATNHITNNLENLNLGNKEYKGTQSILLGNGRSINITHTGNANIFGKRELHLNNLLRVPQIKKKSNKCLSICQR